MMMGDNETEWKLKAATKFTSDGDSSNKLTSQNKLYRGISIVTTSCIYTELDSHRVYCVRRDMLPTSIQNLFQEMGR